jgi:hypothetical protein
VTIGLILGGIPAGSSWPGLARKQRRPSAPVSSRRCWLRS